MRFMGLLTADSDSPATMPASHELLEKMGKFMEEATKAGIQFMCDGLQPSPQGARVKLSGGQVTVTDCSFSEAQGRAAPCAMFDVDSILEAVQWAASLLQVLGEGECEILPLCEA